MPKPHLTQHLRSEEASQVLDSLLKEHPELATKAEALSKEVLVDVSPEEVAEDVLDEFEAVDDIDNLNSRAGSTRWGYVEPADAACEICDEAFEPFRQDLKRRLEAGAIDALIPFCQGLLWGLYRARGLSGGTVEWADKDWFDSEAGELLTTFKKEIPKLLKGQKRSIGPFLPEGFLKEKTPDWESWIRKDFAGLCQ